MRSALLPLALWERDCCWFSHFLPPPRRLRSHCTTTLPSIPLHKLGRLWAPGSTALNGLGLGVYEGEAWR